MEPSRQGNGNKVENQVSKKEEGRSSWLDFIAMVLAFLGAFVSFLGAILTFSSQAQTPTASLWPLPGLVLLDWVLLGSIGFFTALFSFRHGSTTWVSVAWFITGTFIPLIILGAFSIGLAVLVAFLLFVVSTVIFAVRQRTKWLTSFGLLMLGSICNLGVLMLMIRLGKQIPSIN
jgi:hypothetical protein